MRKAQRRLTDRELNTVLASLRVLQANPTLFPHEFTIYKSLSKTGIDRLCYDFNTGRVRT